MLGLSDELLELVWSSLAHEAGERPSAPAFVDLLEEATPDITMLEDLVKFNANSEDDVQKLHHIFERGDNSHFGMREEETLVIIEVFDQVTPLSQHPFIPLGKFSPRPL